MHPIKCFNLKAKLDIEVIQKSQYDLNKRGMSMTIPNMIMAISELNVEVISILLINSIKKKTECTEIEIMKAINFPNAMDIIGELIKISLPNKEVNITKIFDDEEELEEDPIDWDFGYMSYLWYSILKRSDDYLEKTPKEFFEQIKFFEKQANNNKNEIVEEV